MRAVLLIYSVAFYFVLGLIFLLSIQPAFSNPCPKYRILNYSHPLLKMEFEDGSFNKFNFKTVYNKRVVWILE
jgi:hypothetical protein